MELIFLGTGSAYPSPKRCSSGILLRHSLNGSQWLFDCGEGIQMQIQKDRSGKMSKIKKIFITHLHGDHLFGLPGLLSTSGITDDGDNTTDIYGPVGLQKYLDTIFQIVMEKANLKYVVHEIEIPDVFATDNDDQQDISWKLFYDDETKKTVYAVPLKHTILCLGYIVMSDDKVGCLNAQLANKLGVKRGPDLKKLKDGEDITTESGEVVRSSDVLGPSIPGVNVGIMGDSCDSRYLVRFMNSHNTRRLHYLVHECTLQNEQEVECIGKGHSTPRMCSTWASEMDVSMLILTHFSQRYRDEADEVECESEGKQGGDSSSKSKDQHTTGILRQQVIDGGLFKGDVVLAKDFLHLDLNLPE